MTQDIIAGVQYRCKECGWNFGDPCSFKDVKFENWAAAIRAHMAAKHMEIAGARWASMPINDCVLPFFIWTTPTGKEVVTTAK